MLKRRVWSAAAVAAVIGWAAAPQLGADTADQRVFFTFSGPVALPGVGLAPGKYLFHRADPASPNVVQVLSADGKRVFGMFFTIPVQRTEPAATPEVRFMETSPGSPLPIKTYWLQGDLMGHEFIYPRAQAMLLASNTREPVLTTKARTTRTSETSTHALSRVSAGGKEAAVDSNARPMAAIPSGKSLAGEPAPASPLPKTASATPLVALTGLLSLGLAATIRLARGTRRV